MRFIYLLFLNFFVSTAIAQLPVTSGNVLWLKADAAVYTDVAATTLATSGQTVAQWNDQSGNTAHAICTPVGYRPTFVTNAINGKPVLRFTNNYLQTPNIDLSTTDKTDIYVVYKSVAPNTNWETVVEHGADFNTYVGFNIFENAQTVPYTGIYTGSSGGGFNTKNYPFKANEFKIVNSSFDKAAAVNAKTNLRINSKDITLFDQNNASGSGNFANYPLYIGNRGNAVGSYPLSGDIAEIILYNRKLTPTEKTQIETYLNTKYNIACNVNTPLPGSGNCLQMGNYGAYAQDDADIDFGANDFSVEFWTMKRALSSNYSNVGCINKWNTSATPGTNEWSIITSTNGTDNIPSFTIESGTTSYTVNATTSLPINKWYHIVAVKENTNLKIYVNGILEGTTIIPANTSINNVANRNLLMGYYPNGYANNSNLDEVRIWNTALSQTTIRDWMCKKETALHPNHAMLTRYYKFDETSGTIFGNQINNCVTEAYGNGGILTTSGAPIGDNSAYNYTANTGTANINIGTPTDNFTATMNAGTSAGIHVYGVNELPNNQNFPGIVGNNKYAGVFVVNGNGAATYNATYNYTNNTAVNPTNEPTLKLYKRTDNAATAWSAASNQTLNTGTKTITATGQNTEYLLASAITPVPPTCYGTFNNAADLIVDAASQHPSQLLDSLVNNFTYEMWVNPSQPLGGGGTSGDRYIVWPEQATAWGKSGYGIGVAIGTNGIRVYAHAAGYLVSQLSSSYTFTGWTHVAVVMQNSTPFIYINGLPVAAGTGPIGTVRASDGYINTNYYNQYFGSSTDFRLWNYARSGSEIMNNMNALVAPNSTGLVSNFIFENLYNGNGQIVKNRSTNLPLLNLDKITSGTHNTPSFNCNGNNFPAVVAPNCGAKFNGTNSSVSIINSPTTMPNKGTIEFWMNQPSFSDWQIPLSTFSPTVNAGTFTNGMYFQTYANGNLYFIYASSYSVYGIELLGTLTPNKSYHVALSWDLTANNIKGYIDGRLIFIKSLTTTFPTTFPRLTLGGGFDNGRYFNGNLDEVRLWNVERTQTEIINNANTVTGSEAGLQAYYHFNENILNGNGQTVLNKCVATGASLNGTTVNYVKFPCSLAPPTCGITLSGVAGQGVQIPHNAAFNSTTNVTYEAWVKPSTDISNWRTIVGKGADIVDAPTLYVGKAGNVSGTAGKVHVEVHINGIQTVVAGSTFINDNEWHHIAYTYDGLVNKIYVDGVLDGTLNLSGTITTNTADLKIGYGFQDNNYPFIGKIDEVRIWNTTRTVTELQTAMNASLIGTEAGLVAYYNFNNNDRSGQNRVVTNFCTTTGIALNGLTYGTSLTPLFDCAPPPFTNPECNLVLNGTTDYIIAPNNAAINLTHVSVGAYVKTSDASSTYKNIVWKDVDGSNANYAIYITNTNKAQFTFQRSPLSGTAPNATGTTTITDGNWHYLVGTYDGANLKIYVDGVLEATTADASTPMTGPNPLYIGSVAGANKFNGSLDEISVWNTALSLAQIQSLIGQGLVGNEAGLVAYYNFAGNTKNGQGITITNSCTATGAAINGNTVGTSTTPIFTCSELPITPPTCNLLMNGVNDKVYVTRASGITYPTVTNNFTMEVKAKALYSKGGASGAQYDGVFSGQNFVIFPDQGGDGFAPGHAGVGISLGTNGVAVYEHSTNYMPARIALNNYNTNDWVHLTVVSTNGVLKLYINGALVSTVGASGYVLHPSGDMGGYWGNAFAGYVGEVRVWNASLSGDQIRTNLNATLTGAEANLISLFKFGNNTVNGKNKSITGLGSFGAANPYLTAGTDCTPIFTCANTTAVNKDAAPGSGNMISQNGTALSFAEIGDVGNTPIQGSMMAWFNANTLKEKAFVFSTSHFRNSKGGYKGINLFTRADGKLQMTFGTDTTDTGFQDTVLVANVIQPNRWYHFAMSWDTLVKTYTTYINGIQTATGTTNYWPAKFESFKAGIGLQPTATNAWNGKIDELSMWNKILSLTEIRDQLAKKINATQANYANLAHYYRFDNNTCGGNAISDYKGTVHGIIYNTSLPISSAPIGDTSRYDYSGVISTASVPFGLAGKDTIAATITAGTNVQSVHVYGVNEKPNTQNGQVILAGNDRYAGVFVAADTNQLNYNLKYSYNVNPYLPPSYIHDQLLLYKRTHNADGIWVLDATANVDSIAKTYITTGRNSEYMLGYSLVPVRPHLGPDTTVFIICDNETYNLLPLYNTGSFATSWSTATPTAAPLGSYSLIATSSFGYKDTAVATVSQKLAVWTGAISNDWHNAANWNSNIVPDSTFHVIIPAGTPNPCIISAANASAASVQAKTSSNFSLINNRILLIAASCGALPVWP